MTDLFFYGTLRYVPLLERVLGRPSDTIDLTQASLVDHAVFAVQDQIFPMIQHQNGSVAEGVLVRGLTQGDIDRLTYYEGGFEYDLEQVNLRTADGSDVTGMVFFPTPGLWTPGPLWDLHEWTANWGELTLLAAEEVMAHFGIMTAQQIAARFSAIRMRAEGRRAARHRKTDQNWDVQQDVIVHEHKRPYLNYFAMEEADLQFRHFDGQMGPVLNRGALMTGHAVVVVPYDPKTDSVLLIEQFRAPVYLVGDPAPWMIEAVAGMIDPGESPQEAAKREAREEAHVTLRTVIPAGNGYSSSGSSSEYLHLFVGIAELDGQITDGGLDSEGENIRSHKLTFDELMDRVDTHQLKDLPLLTIANWLGRHRDRIRRDHS